MKRTLLSAIALCGMSAAQPAPAPPPPPPDQPPPAILELRDAGQEFEGAFRELTRSRVVMSAMAGQPPAPAPQPPVPPVPPRDGFFGDPYRSGMRALDNRRYAEAVTQFERAAGPKQPKPDGALYWKAYALNKLGKRPEALAVLDQLQRDFAASPWLNDAKALRLELQQSSGQPVSPESQSDEDLKLLAINSLMHNDPNRAMPLLEKILADPAAAPKLKERALFVLAQSRSDAKARETLMRIAQGGGNPDLQVKAIEFLGIFGDKAELAQMYSSSSAPQVKEAALNGLFMARDADRLLEIARGEKDPKWRASAIEKLGLIRSDKVAGALAGFYGSESDPKVKRSVLDALFLQRNSKQLIAIARSEKDPGLKRSVVERLSMMKDPEAAAYMMELLK